MLSYMNIQWVDCHWAGPLWQNITVGILDHQTAWKYTRQPGLVECLFTADVEHMLTKSVTAYSLDASRINSFTRGTLPSGSRFGQTGPARTRLELILRRDTCFTPETTMLNETMGDLLHYHSSSFSLTPRGRKLVACFPAALLGSKKIVEFMVREQMDEKSNNNLDEDKCRMSLSCWLFRPATSTNISIHWIARSEERQRDKLIQWDQNIPVV